MTLIRYLNSRATRAKYVKPRYVSLAYNVQVKEENNEQL